MGNSHGSLRDGSLDDEDDEGHDLELQVPDEVKPRGRIGTRSGNSYNKKGMKSGSLMSALSMDIENPEAERVKKDFEMFKRNKENEISILQRSEKKAQEETKRLRNELQISQRTRNRLITEREEALRGEQQALARAHTFEQDRDKVQRQFKIFRETKEKEIQNLLRTKRELENKLSRYNADLIPDDNNRTMDGSSGGDWWNQTEQDSTAGSTNQLHNPLLCNQEFTSSFLQLEMAQGLARDVWGFPTDCMNNSTLKLFISYTPDMQSLVDSFMKNQSEKLRSVVEHDGHYLSIINFPCENDLQNYPDAKLISLRKVFVEQSTILLGFVGDTQSKYTDHEIDTAHLKSPGDKPTIICIKQSSNGVEDGNIQLKTEIRRTDVARILDSYTINNEENLFSELKSHVINFSERLRKIVELGIDPEKLENPEEASIDLGFNEPETGQLGGCPVWDEHCHSEHLETFYNSAKHSLDSLLEKYFDRLTTHISSPAMSPPLIISGAAGSGKTVLLARWIQQHQMSGSAGVILYHFVGNRNSVSADPVHMIRRLTSQLMQHAVNPPALTCDPSRLMEEFPRWLEKVSSRINGGVTVIIDGLDKFQQGEAHVRWLLDPLPVDSRVIVTVNEDTCHPAWRAWQQLKIEPLTARGVKDLLKYSLQQKHCYLDPRIIDTNILTHCRTPETCTPLYISVLAACLASIGNQNVKKLHHQLDQCLGAANVVDLYLVVLDFIREELEITEHQKGTLKKLLKLIYSSRNGIGDWECLELLPGISWTFWAALSSTLLDFNVIFFRTGLIHLAHDQVGEAIRLKYFPESNAGKQLNLTRQTLITHHQKSLVPGKVTCHMSDELPWLQQQISDKDGLKNSMLCLCVFLRLYVRGRCNELIGYWQYLGIDKNHMAELYYSITKSFEQKADRDVNLSLLSIADIYEAQGCFLRDLGMLKESCNPLQRSLELRETNLDPDHPKVAQSLHQLASLYAQWNKYSSAESLYKQALEIYESAFGRDHSLVAKQLDALVVLYQKQNKHQVAEPLKHRANTIRKKNRVPRIRCSSESESQQTQSKRSQPSPKKQRMKLTDLSMGPDSPGLASKLMGMGVVYYLQSNHSEAESLFKSALQMRQNVLPDDHIDLGQSHKNLAALYYKQNQLEKAETNFNTALTIINKHYSSEHEQVISLMRNLALVYKKQQDFTKAAPLYEVMCENLEKSENKRLQYASALFNLAFSYCHIDRKLEAEPLYQKCLQIYESGPGMLNRQIADTLRNLALLKYEQGKHEAAARLYKRYTDMEETLKKEKNQSRASSMASISMPQLNQPRTQKVFLETLTDGPS